MPAVYSLCPQFLRYLEYKKTLHVDLFPVFQNTSKTTNAYLVYTTSYVMRCTIWHHLHNLKNVKNTNGGVCLFASVCNFTKSNIPPWVFSCFLNCTNGTKTRNASHIQKNLKNMIMSTWFSRLKELVPLQYK